MLGQRGELLQYAARPGEQVTIGVLEGMQTAIVEAGAQVVVNFNHFFQETSGLLLPAGDLTVTISRQLLDESGRPLPGTVEELSPSDGRVSVSVGGDAGQHFVNIADAVLDDSGVYAIEVCSESGTPEEVCQRANVTLFVLDCELLKERASQSGLVGNGLVGAGWWERAGGSGLVGAGWWEQAGGSGLVGAGWWERAGGSGLVGAGWLEGLVGAGWWERAGENGLVGAGWWERAGGSGVVGAGWWERGGGSGVVGAGWWEQAGGSTPWPRTPSAWCTSQASFSQCFSAETSW